MNEFLKAQPKVLHIGFSKCASTYLRALFRAHPDVHLVFKSGFFTPFLAQDMTFKDYQDLFVHDESKVNVESDEHLILPGIHPELGVRTTSLESFERVADKILKYLPNVKIILIIRNQVSLIVSRYSEFLITGGSLHFEDFALRLAGDDKSGNRYFQNYYFKVIRILENRFPRDNLLVLLQEAMREDEPRLTRTISQFAGLKDSLGQAKGLRSERKSLSFIGMKLLRWVNQKLVVRPGFGGDSPTTRLPHFVYQNIGRAVRAIDYYVLARLSPASARALSPTLRLLLMAHFEEDNQKLQAYFGSDLAKYGYLKPALRQ